MDIDTANIKYKQTGSLAVLGHRGHGLGSWLSQTNILGCILGHGSDKQTFWVIVITYKQLKHLFTYGHWPIIMVIDIIIQNAGHIFSLLLSKKDLGHHVRVVVSCLAVHGQTFPWSLLHAWHGNKWNCSSSSRLI